MPPEFLIAEFQIFWAPFAFLLKSVNMLWGLGAAILVPALVFWLGGSERGFRAAWITAFSGCINALVKWTLALPRPFYVTERFTPLKLTDGYGMPSGNAQGPASMLAALAKGGPGWIWAVGAPLVLLAGIARIYYGVHSVNQVLVGWGLGLALAWLAIAAERPLVGAAKRLGPRRALGVLLLLTALVFAVWYGAAKWSVANKPPPTEWAERFAELQVELGEEDEPYSFVQPVEAGEVAGLLLGYGLVGLAFLARGMPRLGRRRERLLAVAIGIPAFFLWRQALRALLGGVAAVTGELGYALALIPIVATLPPVIFLLVPGIATRLARMGSS